MEFADAGDLAQLLRNANGRRFKEDRILDLFGQISQVFVGFWLKGLGRRVSVV